MDTDFRIDLEAPNGLAAIKPHLHACPFQLEVGMEEGVNSEVLVQTKVSTVAGLYYESATGHVHHYGCCVSDSNPGEPEEVMLALSSAFGAANLSHRIYRIIHELDEDQEVVSYAAKV